jgi:putative ABC transport system permease protein
MFKTIFSLAALLEQAQANAIRNKARTFASIIGVAIGICAVMAVSTVSKGGYFYILQELKTFGLNSVWVHRDFSKYDPSKAMPAGTGIENADFLTIDDRCCPSTNRVSPVVFPPRDITIRYGQNYLKSKLQGVGLHYLEINNDQIAQGRGFVEYDIKNAGLVAIIGKKIKKRLLGEGIDPIGAHIYIGDHRYTIIGILDLKSRSFLKSINSVKEKGINNRILVPYTSLQKQISSYDINTLHLESNNLESAQKAADEVINYLEKRHHNKFPYISRTMQEYIHTTDNIIGSVSTIGIIGAGMSLVVSIMGIINVMITSVLERTREIGLRQAVGARKRDILLQFIFEATIMSSIGGIIGLLSGVVFSIALAEITGLPIIPSISIIVLAVIVSIVLGILAGLYPALRASKITPVEALRYE